MIKIRNTANRFLLFMNEIRLWKNSNLINETKQVSLHKFIKKNLKEALK